MEKLALHVQQLGCDDTKEIFAAFNQVHAILP